MPRVIFVCISVLVFFLVVAGGCSFRAGAEPIQVPAEELAIFDEFLLGTVDLERISFYERGPRGSSAYFYWNDAVFLAPGSAEAYADDPAIYRPVILHELTHAWQDQHGVGAFLGDDDYAFTLLPEKHLTEYSIEQQAQIISAGYILHELNNIPVSCRDCGTLGRDAALQILDRRRDELADAL